MTGRAPGADDQAGDLFGEPPPAVRRMLGPGAPPVTRSWDTFQGPTRRLALGYGWDDGLPPLHVVGQNPSKASKALPDHTVTLCARRAWRSGHGSLEMWNLFPTVATNPSALLAAGRDTAIEAAALGLMLGTIALRPGTVLIAAGDSAWMDHHTRATAVVAALQAAGTTLACLGLTSRGLPRHPSRTGYAKGMEPWAGPWPDHRPGSRGRAGRSGVGSDTTTDESRPEGRDVGAGMRVTARMVQAAAQALAQAEAAPRNASTEELEAIPPADAAIAMFPTPWHRWAASRIIAAALAAK